MADDPDDPAPPPLLVERDVWLARDVETVVTIPVDPATTPGDWLPSSSLDRVRYLIDGAATFAEMARAIATATGEGHFICLLGWFLDAELPLDPSGATFLSLCKAAAARGVEIRVQLWKMPLATDVGELSTLAWVFRRVRDPAGLALAVEQADTSNHRAELALNALPHTAALLDDRHLPNGSHHQKILVVNGRDGLIGFCGGIDLNVDRLDVGDPTFGPGTPLHDVHARVVGPAAEQLLAIARDRWTDLAAARGLATAFPAFTAPAPASPAKPRQHVAIATTYGNPLGHGFEGGSRPGDTYRFAPTGTRSAAQMLAAAISRAERFIYIEDQYFFSDDAVELLLAALGRGVAHITIVLTWMEYLLGPMAARRLQCLARLGYPHDSRVRVYCLTPRAGAHTYVHSKLTIVDDHCALLGSVNYNRRSWTNDSEVLAGIVDDLALDDYAFALPRRLRIALWAEHLDMRTPQGRAELADGVAASVHWDTAPRVARHPTAVPTDFLGAAGARLAGIDPAVHAVGGPAELTWAMIDPDGS